MEIKQYKRVTAFSPSNFKCRSPFQWQPKDTVSAQMNMMSCRKHGNIFHHYFIILGTVIIKCKVTSANTANA